MDHIGIDVHKRESQICILADGGELIERRIRTEPERFAAVLGRWGRLICCRGPSSIGRLADRLHAVGPVVTNGLIAYPFSSPRQQRARGAAGRRRAPRRRGAG